MFEKLSEYLDNELDGPTYQKIEAHAKECIKCKTGIETLKRTIDLCKHLENNPVPARLSKRLIDMLHHMV